MKNKRPYDDDPDSPYDDDPGYPHEGGAMEAVRVLAVIVVYVGVIGAAYLSVL